MDYETAKQNGRATGMHCVQLTPDSLQTLAFKHIHRPEPDFKGPMCNIYWHGMEKKIHMHVFRWIKSLQLCFHSLIIGINGSIKAASLHFST